MKIFEKKIYIGLLISVLVGVIGVTFAYFVVGVEITGNVANTTMSPGNMVNVELVTDQTETVNFNDVWPGQSREYPFAIEITPTAKENSATYQLRLNVSSNGFVKCDATNYNAITNDCSTNDIELRYILKNASGEEVTSGDLTGINGIVNLGDPITSTVNRVSNASGGYNVQSVNYTLVIEFVDTGYDQNHNTSKNFNASIDAIFAE